jgi:hypothetical protein
MNNLQCSLHPTYVAFTTGPCFEWFVDSRMVLGTELSEVVMSGESKDARVGGGRGGGAVGAGEAVGAVEVAGGAGTGSVAPKKPRLCRLCGEVKKGHTCTMQDKASKGAAPGQEQQAQAQTAAGAVLPGAWLPFMQMLQSPGIPPPAALSTAVAPAPALAAGVMPAGEPPPDAAAGASSAVRPAAKRPAEGDGPATAKKAKVQGDKLARAPYKCRLCGQPAKGHVCPNKDLPAPPKAAQGRPRPPPCPHGFPGGVYARLRKCVECRGEVCEHNRRKLMCRFCTPENTAICIHNRDKGICRDCGVATRRCIHDRVKSVCKVFTHTQTHIHTHTHTHCPSLLAPPHLFWLAACRSAAKAQSASTSGRKPTVKTVAAHRYVRTTKSARRVKNAVAPRSCCLSYIYFRSLLLHMSAQPSQHDV